MGKIFIEDKKKKYDYCKHLIKDKIKVKLRKAFVFLHNKTYTLCFKLCTKFILFFSLVYDYIFIYTRIKAVLVLIYKNHKLI